MARIIGVLVLILSFVLFPPATLALISNNAVPGDVTYPIKRGLEDVIFAAASVNPTTKAWFASARSDRRFKEVTILLSKGEKVEQTLEDLVTQTEIAAAQLNEVSNPQKKQEIINNLSAKIDNYNQVLKESNADILPEVPTQTPFPAPTATPASVASSAVSSTPRSIPTPKPNPTKSPSVIPYPVETSKPFVSSPAPTSQPTDEPLPTPSPNLPTSSNQSEDIAQAIQRLEDIKRRMEMDREDKEPKQEKREKEDKKSNEKEEGRKDRSDQKD